MAFTASILTCIIWLSQSLRFVEMIVNRGLTTGEFFYLTMLLLPNFLTVILPVALFTSITFIYTKLISDRELVIMQAAGLSHMDIAKPAIIISFMVALGAYALNLFLVPKSYTMFRELQWDIRYNYTHVLLQGGAFNFISPEITVYVRERTKDGQLLGVLVHDKRNALKPYSLLAERGAMVESEDSARVVLFNGNRQEMDAKTNQLSILYFDRYIFDMTPASKRKEVRSREPRERMLFELLNVANDKTVSAREYGKHIVEAHKRLASPMFNLGFALSALACLLYGDFSRRNQMPRVLLAVGIMVSIQAGALGLDNLVAKKIALVPLMYAYAILPIIVGYYFMVRRRWRKTAPKDMELSAALNA